MQQIRLEKIFLICSLIFIISACQNQSKTQTEAQISADNLVKEEEVKNLEEKAEEKKFSPDRRLEAFLIFPEQNRPVYRLTIADNEQSKIIFSREFNLIDEQNNTGTRSATIEKVLDNFVLLKEFSGEKENLKYLLIQPDLGEVLELSCDGFTQFEIIDLNEKNYKCKGFKTNDQATEELFDLPEFKEMNKNKFSQEQKQVKELENIKAELWPFDEKAALTPDGKRATLKVFKDNNLIYEKSFSGKCTGCQWVNQDNFKESFRIESLQEDKVLLTQVLTEQGGEPMFSSILIIPSNRKEVHLDCKEEKGEIAYVNSINNQEYECKYINVAKAPSKMPLPVL